MRDQALRMIAVSEKNYLALKKLGSAKDSFNDVVTEVLKQGLQAGPGRATNSKDQNAGTDITTLERDYTRYEKPLSVSHKLYAIPVNSDQVKQIVKPTVVTICLTNTHEECTGNYVDKTNSFRIRCKCRCHLGRRINWELRK
jgi:hypothetical protein